MIATSSSTDEVVRSARAAQRHLKVYEQLLGVRIQMQKPIQLLNKLPPVIKEGGEFHCLQLGSLDDNVASKLRGILSDVSTLSGVNDSAFQQSPHHTDADLNAIWSEISSHQQRQFSRTWRPVLDKMHDKTLLNGGVKSQSLKVFHTSFWNKIDNVLADENKSLEKSRPFAAESARLGICEAVRQIDEENNISAAEALQIGLLKAKELNDDENEEDEERNLRRVGHKQKRIQWRDGEVFEDSALYAMLLKSFLQCASANSSLAGQDLATLRQLKRRKSNVDRKASKGRKIRYVVHNKLENFMFPTPLGAETTALAFDSKRLFNSLFQ